ncbi:hypothetical protein GAMM_50001 [Gammaproteobacteria bacterium]
MVARWYWSESIRKVYQAYVSEGTELRKKLLEETFIDLVKKHYAESYFKTKPDIASVAGLQDFIKSDYIAEPKEAAVVIFQKKRFMVIDGFGERYGITFEYRDGQLIYDNIYADAVFDDIWDDINLIMEFVKENSGGMTRDRAELFRQYLIEDADDYANSNDLKQQIREIFLRFDIEELRQQVEEDILEDIKEKRGVSEGKAGKTALEVFAKERFSVAAVGIAPYEDTRQTLIQPFVEQYGVKLWTTLYEKAPLPKKSIERIRRFLMNNYYELFLQLVPYEISHSKKLEEDIAADNKDAMEFKSVMTRFLESLKGSLLVTSGGYGKASYVCTKDNLAMLYADELALKEVYKKYSSAYPEVMALFKKMYRWTKDCDAEIELEQELQNKKDRALEQYLYSYEEELAQADAPPRSLLKREITKKKIPNKAITPEDEELANALIREGYQWNQQQIAI